MTVRPSFPASPLAAAFLLVPLLLAACQSPPRTAASGDMPPVVAIGQVQGSGATSPLLDRRVTVEGTVHADMREGLGGWFVQDRGDGDPATSDGLFIRAGDDSPALARGDRIRVSGRVVEHGERGASLTALIPDAIVPLGRGEVRPLVLRDAPRDWERLEGMLLRIEAPLTVGGHHELVRFGVLLASFGGRLPTPTEVARPGDAARRLIEDQARRSLLLDDASAVQRPGRIWYLPDDAQAPRSGSLVTAAEGVLDQRWGGYRLQLTAPLQLQPAPRPPAPQVDGDVRVATLNLENLFNGDGRGGGFPTERGARSEAQYRIQLAKHVATLQALDADVVALMELENDGHGPDASIAQLAEALNADGGDWRFVDAGDGTGGDAIRVGLLYRASRVRTEGRAATLETGPFARGSRPPLAQAFVPVADGRDDGPAFIVVANHFKSKGCRGAEGDQRDSGDGQACWNPARVDAARLLDSWLATDPTGTGSDLVVITGDLNSYAQEDPIRLLIDNGWRDAFAEHPPLERYSYVFDGRAGRLDHALLSPALAARLAGAAKWHSNADEPANVGYRDAKGDERASPWRSSDHDPLIAGFHLRAR